MEFVSVPKGNNQTFFLPPAFEMVYIKPLLPLSKSACTELSACIAASSSTFAALPDLNALLSLELQSSSLVSLPEAI